MAHPSQRQEHLAIDGNALRGTGKQIYGAEEPQRIDAPGNPLSRWRRDMTVWNGVRSRPVLISTTRLVPRVGRGGTGLSGRRRTPRRDKHSREGVSGWTTLAPQRCAPQLLAQVIRAHWSEENRLHWRRAARDGARIGVVCAGRQWRRCWPCSTASCSP